MREVAGTAATADERRLTQREIENLRVIVGFCVAVVVDGIISSAGVVRICSSRECFGVWWLAGLTQNKIERSLRTRPRDSRLSSNWGQCWSV